MFAGVLAVRDYGFQLGTCLGRKIGVFKLFLSMLGLLQAFGQGDFLGWGEQGDALGLLEVESGGVDKAILNFTIADQPVFAGPFFE